MEGYSKDTGRPDYLNKVKSHVKRSLPLQSGVASVPSAPVQSPQPQGAFASAFPSERQAAIGHLVSKRMECQPQLKSRLWVNADWHHDLPLSFLKSAYLSSVTLQTARKMCSR